ncbi:hypothetical protein INT48_004381 [Thamnidium elegans]|uniref:Telomere length regulation protein conserved domain-containing protein n=1 Tax=Thamnidium elegans TaxID=101142 RepID=A0A8H7STJ7_9FUNG|nr:hypothetical protein INT48_004381 [Thamnidium elegans]
MTSLKELQELLNELDQQSLADNAQFDAVLNALSKPLEWLNDPTMTTTQQLTLVNDVSWKRHVWNVFKELVPRWNFSLSTHRPLLESTLVCLDSRVAFAMAKVSLPVLIECLSTQQQDASLDTLEAYASYLKFLCLDKHVFRLYAVQSTKNDATFFCNLLCSIPGHLANVFGVQLDQVFFNTQHEWYIDRKFYAKMSKRLAETLDTKTTLFAKELVSKVTRQGYENILIQGIYSYARMSPDIWSSVLAPSFNQLMKAILYHVKETVLPKSSIYHVSKELSLILFSQPDTKQLYIEEFLNTALLRLSKSTWADDRLARLAICTVIHDQGFDSAELSSASSALVTKFTKRVIETWSDPAFIKHAIAYLPEDVIRYTIMTQTALFQSVSKYFDSGDKAIAQLGAVIAEAISGKTDQEKPIKTGLLDSDVELQKIKALVDTRDIFTIEDEQDIKVDIVTESDNQETDSDDDLEAYLMEEESDDEGLKKEELSKSKTKKPVFVRDLIRYLQDQSDPLKLEIGLNAAEQIIRQKTGAGTELSEYSIELAKYLIAFPETFEIDQFRTLQQNALIALVVAVPETVTGFIIDQFYDRNTSAGQKQLILGVISLAVRELSNWTSSNSGVEETKKELEGPQMVGTTVFVSKRMQLQKNNQAKTQRNRLAGLAGPIFFFPLLVGWWEGAQGRIKYWVGNNNVLAERFIMTLNVILHCSTNLPDKRNIVKEYFDFVSSMRYANQNSLGIKKALLFGIDTIVNTSYKDQEVYLIQHYTKELSETKDWLEVIMENNSESTLQEKAIGILVRLSQIAMTASHD